MTASPSPFPFVVRHAGLAVTAVITVAAAAWRLDRGARSTPAGPPHPVAATPQRLVFEHGLDSLGATLASLDSALQGAGAHRSLVAFRSARRAYKGVEALVTHYSPTLASQLNGPPVDQDGDAPPPPLGAPAAFQTVETALFAPSGALQAASRSVAAMRQAVTQFRPFTIYLNVSEADVLDAARLEVARVETLGLAGFDTDQSGDATTEAADALDGLRGLIRASWTGRRAPSHALVAVDTTLKRAVMALRAEPVGERLDRLQFIVRYGNPLARAIAAARRELPAGSPLRRVWVLGAPSVFDRGAFDGSAYAPEFAPSQSAALVQLGKRLFFEPRLSGPGTRSCATCHNPRLAFTDGRARAEVLPGQPAQAARNTPTLINVALQPALFADERAGTLEEQVGVVLASPAEMARSADFAAERLWPDTSYRAAFRRAFNRAEAEGITGRDVRVAVAAYLRTLKALDSRFDRAVRGDSLALTAEERFGFTVFMGKARCGTCHFAPLFSGTMPPAFTSSEPEIIGVPASRDGSRPQVDGDPGRGAVDHWEAHRHAFKVPTLRNVALTAPYMHNGVFETLTQVIEFYDKGGGAGLGATLPAQTLPARPLHLTPAERDALVAFLRSLTDSTTQ